MVFDHVLPDGVNRATAVHDYASGKSVNVARVLHALGENAVAVGFAGGARGEALLRDLDVAGIRHEFVRVDAETRQCVTVIDRAAGTATELVEESKPVRPDDWDRLARAFDQLIPRAEGCVLSGSLPPGAPPDFYLSCLRRLPPKIPVVVDARGEPMRLALRRGRFVAKMNRDELTATVGSAIDSDARMLEAARQVMPDGGSVVITAGRGRVVAFDAGRAWRIVPPTVQAISAVGSGDAFAAGLVSALVAGQSLPEACALGAACGAANAMTELAGHLSPGDVKRLRPNVRVETLDPGLPAAPTSG